MSCTDFCEYTTNKEVRIRSVSLGFLKSLICVAVFIYMCYILVTEKRYQKKDSIISSVHTKVKGVLDVDSRIWDTAEYVFPSPGGDSFFVLTNIIKTEGQEQGRCPEFPSPKTICSRPDICKKGYADPQSNGIQTGQCIKYNTTIRTCEISAWCPVEPKTTPEKNILPEYNVSCIYDKFKAPQCPIFRLGDILKEAGENFSQVAVLGGIIGIEILWKCDLDYWAFNCHPKYSFRRLDEKIIDERLYPGLNFRFARYYKTNQAEQRTLIKAYGIRFDIQVYGIGGQFMWYELVLFIGSYLSYFGLATVLIDFLITRYYTSCCPQKSALKYYDDLKYEKASGPCILKPLRYVSFVDQDYLIMVDTKLMKSLQATKGDHIQRENILDIKKIFKQRQISARIPVPANECEIQLLDLKHSDASSSRPSWCKCLKCVDRDTYEDQLCCRFGSGECITNSDIFKKMVISIDTLVYMIQYNNPLLKRNAIGKDELIECAHKQYIQWRFGSNEDVLGFAMIPSCCKYIIAQIIKQGSDTSA
ncbi:P2X purinoceptor 7-like isoform 2-T2 [Discoglossus pictus]